MKMTFKELQHKSQIVVEAERVIEYHTVIDIQLKR